MFINKRCYVSYMPIPDNFTDLMLKEKQVYYGSMCGCASDGARILRRLPEKPFRKWELYEKTELLHGMEVIDDILAQPANSWKMTPLQQNYEQHVTQAQEARQILRTIEQEKQIPPEPLIALVEFYHAIQEAYLVAASEVESARAKR